MKESLLGNILQANLNKFDRKLALLCAESTQKSQKLVAKRFYEASIPKKSIFSRKLFDHYEKAISISSVLASPQIPRNKTKTPDYKLANLFNAIQTNQNSRKVRSLHKLTSKASIRRENYSFEDHSSLEKHRFHALGKESTCWQMSYQQWHQEKYVSAKMYNAYKRKLRNEQNFINNSFQTGYFRHKVRTANKLGAKEMQRKHDYSVIQDTKNRIHSIFKTRK